MSILQRFFLGRVLAAFIPILFFLLGLILMVEVFEMRDHLALDAAAARQLLSFLLLRLPSLGYLILPLALFLAVLFVTALLALASETTAVRAGGVGILRWTLPVHLLAVVVALVALVGSEFYVAETAARADHIRRVEIQKRAPVRAELADMAVSHEGRYILAERYYPAEGMMDGVVLIIPNSDHDAARVVRRLARLTFVDGAWRSGVESADTELQALPAPALLELLASRSAVRLLRERPIETVRLSEILREIREMRGLVRLGASYAEFEAEVAVRLVRLQSKLAFPATIPLLVLLGVYLGARAGRRRGFGLIVADAVLYSLGYMLMLQLSLRMGEMAGRLAAAATAAPFLPWITPAILAIFAWRRRRLD